MSKLWTVLEEDGNTTTYAMVTHGGTIIRTHTRYRDPSKGTFAVADTILAATETTVFLPGITNLEMIKDPFRN